MAKRERPAVKPAPLYPGDTVGIAAPAGCFDEKELSRGISVIEEMGFRVVAPEGIFAAKRYLAGEDRQRVSVLNRLFEDDDVKAVFCARGGYGSIRVAPMLDGSLYAAKPKILVGFSDLSALLWIVNRISGMVVFHGPVVTSLAGVDLQTVESLKEALTSVSPLSIRIAGGVVVSPGRASGVVAGGNIASLCQLVGTPWQPEFRGALLFLEDVNEAPYRIDRMLAQLRLSGCLEGVAGVMLGSFEGCGNEETVFEIVSEHFPKGVPIVGGFPAGHGPVNLTFPIGVEAVLDTADMVLAYREGALAPPGGRDGS